MTSISKSVYLNKLDDIVNKYNNKDHSAIKMKPVDEKLIKLIKKVLDLKVVIMLEYQNIKTFLKKVTFQIGVKKFLWLKKLKILCHGHMLLVILHLIAEEVVGKFYEKELQKQSQKDFRIKK